MTDSAFDATRNYILSTTAADETLEAAARDAAEFGLSYPDSITGSLLTALTSAALAGRPNATRSVVAITPAAGVVGLYLLRGMAQGDHLTCIDSETEHQKLAKKAFQSVGLRPSQYRFLPSRPLEVMGRLNPGAYDVVYGDCRPTDLLAFVHAALPLLSPGGVLIIGDCLLDGIVGDESRTDRDTVAAREADEYVRSLDGVTVSRLPLSGGLTIIAKQE
ncbi:O-methyltransferase [Corynebacterium ulceribovis]|uniref:O-methyltransferase n=1 Tax=Corynebacterium ulceribovis TaxID=487732 RepID=UPI000373918C|nr:class I SAM-dependent methyltransferase [Corynebacterium ulceribovis]